MRPADKNADPLADQAMLANEACVLHELYELTGQHEDAAIRARIDAQAAEDALNGYVSPLAFAWYVNLRPLRRSEGSEAFSAGVRVFDD
jgi:hypothetical protein